MTRDADYPANLLGTFSIAARDRERGEFGVAVSTAQVAVGALCPFVSENAAVATQAFVNVSHGANAIELVDRGVGLSAACTALLDADGCSSYRQLHGVDAAGNTFAFTGDDCVDWCGSLTGEDYTVAGNMLEGDAVLSSMADEFEGADGELVERLLRALEAGNGAGGDKRGRVSAAVLVHSPEPELYHNLRVDDSETPVRDLRAAFERAREVVAETPGRMREMLGDYPEELLDYEPKR